MKRNKDKTPIICRCNNVSRGTLETAIREGCDTMNKIFDATTAGVGPCGGSCRRKILPMLEQYLKTGTFPEKILEDTTGKVLTKPSASETPTSAHCAADSLNPNSNEMNKSVAPQKVSDINNGSLGNDNGSIAGGTKKPDSSDENR